MSKQNKAPVIRSLADLGTSIPLKTELQEQQLLNKKQRIKAGIKPRPAVTKVKKPDPKPPVEEVTTDEVEVETVSLDTPAPAEEEVVAVADTTTVTLSLEPMEDKPRALNAHVRVDGNMSDVELIAESIDVHVQSTDLVPVEEAEVISDAEIRKELISSLLEYDMSNRHKQLEEVYNRLPTARLNDMLDLLRAEWGGSAQFKKSVTDIEELIHRAENSVLTRQRVSLLRQKYTEYHKLAVKVEKALGTDTVIHTMKHTEYHKLLERLVKTHAVLSRAVREMSEMVAFQVSDGVKEGGDIFNPDNTEEMVKILLAVGTSMKTWMLASAEANKQARELMVTRDKLVEEVKNLNQALKFERERYATREEDLRRKAHRRFGMKLALVNGEGMFLARMPGEKAINPLTLELTPHISRAIILNDEAQLRQVYDKLRMWSRPDSKYAKVMKRKGLRPDYLDKVEITLTKI